MRNAQRLLRPICLAWLITLLSAALAHARVAADVPVRCAQDSSGEADVFAALARGFPPGRAPRLFAALGKDRHPALKKLLAAGANPNICHAGLSPMMLAVAAEDAVAVTMLHGAGALLDRPRDAAGATPLHLAAGLARFSMATLLLARGADARLVDDGGNTVLHSLALQPMPPTPALRAMQTGLAGQLLQRQVPLDALNGRGSTALIMAIAAGNEDLMAYLLDQGADPKLANKRGEDALAYARRLGHAALVARLERHIAARTATTP